MAFDPTTFIYQGAPPASGGSTELANAKSIGYEARYNVNDANQTAQANFLFNHYRFATNANWLCCGGCSPQDLAAFTGWPLLINPTSNQVETHSLPVIFAYSLPEGLKGDGPPAPMSQGSGTYGGNQWFWLLDLEAYIGGNQQAAAPVLNVATGTYIGNSGTVTVNVSFDLTQPNSFVLVIANQSTPQGGFRSDVMSGGTARPPGGALNASSLTLTATGFTATGLDVNGPNTITFWYLAVSNPDGTFVKTGQYTGNSTSGSPQSLTVSCAFAKPATPTNLIIFGSGGVSNTSYWQNGYGAGLSTLLVDSSAQLGASSLLYNIASVGSNQFTVGDATNPPGPANFNTQPRYFVGFNVTGLLANVMAYGMVVGAPGATVSGIPFNLGFVMSQVVLANFEQAGIWRLNGLQAGTDSSSFSVVLGNVQDFPTGGVTAIANTSFTLGSTAAPSTDNVGWVAFTGSNSLQNGGPSGPMSLVCPGNSTSGIVGTYYQINLSSSGSAGPAFLYSKLYGSLPPGLILHPDGTISGIPNTAGTYSFVVAVTDTNGGVIGSTSCSITINSAGSSGGPFNGLPLVSAVSGGDACVLSPIAIAT